MESIQTMEQVIIGLIVAAALAAVVRKIIHVRKGGGCGCGCGCSGGSCCSKTKRQ